MGAGIMSPITEGPLNVLCMRWGRAYAPDYVRILKSAVQKYLPQPHRFLCLTDNPESLEGSVETRPLPDIDAGSQERGWNKIALFKPDLYDIKGTALFLDLDIVILRDLSPFFKEEGRLLIIREWETLGTKVGLVQYRGGNSSVFRFRAGDQTQIYKNFRANPQAAQRNFRNEQRFLSAHAQDMRFWSQSLCASFKRDCMAPFPTHLFRPPKPHPKASIIVFHGKPCPHDLLQSQFWGRKTHRGYGAVPWVKNYWREHSAS